jgi:uncharacterized protein
MPSPRRETPNTLVLAIFLLSILATNVAAQTNSDPRIQLFHKGQLRVLIFSGRNNHDWRITTPALRDLLVSTGKFDVRVEEEPTGITSATLAIYDLVVLDYQGPRWGDVTEHALLDFVSSGKGLVVFHGASWAFNGLPVLADHHVPTDIIELAWPEYAKLIGGVWSKQEPITQHAPYHVFTVKFTDKQHPITNGLGDSFVTKDELYHNMRMQPNVHVLATAWDDPNNAGSWPGSKGTGKDEPVLWVLHYGRGRVFHTTLGHDLPAIHDPGFSETFVRGAEWAATGAVTIPAKSLAFEPEPAK